MKEVVLCGGARCCPKLTLLDNGKVQIIDDDGNKVVMEKSQALMITDAIKKLEK